MVRSLSSSRCALLRERWCARSCSAGVLLRPNSVSLTRVQCKDLARTVLRCLNCVRLCSSFQSEISSWLAGSQEGENGKVSVALPPLSLVLCFSPIHAQTCRRTTEILAFDAFRRIRRHHRTQHLRLSRTRPAAGHSLAAWTGAQGQRLPTVLKSGPFNHGFVD